MAAPKGNQFWKIRSKHGRDKIFSSPNILWEEACNYFEWCDNNPIKSERTNAYLLTEGDKSRQNKQVQTEIHKRPYTWGGLEIFLDIDSFRHYKTNKKYKEFFQVINKIDKIIYTQKFEGAVVGIFNHNIIARDLKLVDVQETKKTGKVQLNIKHVRDNEL